eukprot:1582314-Alexandrium_andersonii.AAC.1
MSGGPDAIESACWWFRGCSGKKGSWAMLPLGWAALGDIVSQTGAVPCFDACAPQRPRITDRRVALREAAARASTRTG